MPVLTREPPVSADENGNVRHRKGDNQVLLEHIYRRYARVRLDAIYECIDILRFTTDVNEAISIMKLYLKRNAKIAFEDELEPIVKLEKMHQPINHVSVGSVRGL